MSQPLLRGFTTGATYHILIAQLPFVFGIAVKASRDDPRFFKMFKVIWSYLDSIWFYLYLYLNNYDKWKTCATLIKNIASTNLSAFIISIVSMIILVVIKLGVNDRYKTQLKNIPIPVELMVVCNLKKLKQ